MNLTVLKALDRVRPSRTHSMLKNKMSQSSLLIVLAMFWLLFCGNGCFPSSPAMWKTLSAMRPDLEETPLEDVLLRLMACSTNRCCQYMITLLTLLRNFVMFQYFNGLFLLPTRCGSPRSLSPPSWS